MPGGAHENMRGWSPEEDALLLRLIEVRSRIPRWPQLASHRPIHNVHPHSPFWVWCFACGERRPPHATPAIAIEAPT